MYLSRLKKRGLRVGSNFQMEKGCNIDANFPWLIEIGNNVTFASWVYLTAHDGAAQKHVGYSKVGKISIGNNVFIGARSIIMLGVSIGDNCVIGANSVVITDIPSDSIVAGSPAKIISDINSYKKKMQEQMKVSPVYEKEYTIWGGITEDRKREMNEKLSNGNGFIL